MVYVYWAGIADLPDPMIFPEYMEGLPEIRRSKILRCKRLSGRKQYLGAWLMLKWVFEKHGISTDRIYVGKNGKLAAKEMEFNLSHSQDMVLCVVNIGHIMNGRMDEMCFLKKRCAVTPVGCDLEKIRPVKDHMIDRCFSEKESFYIRSFSKEEDRQRAFFRLWTIKESYVKMTGEGIAGAFERIQIEIEGDQTYIKRDGKRCLCRIEERECDGYQMTVCTEVQDVVEWLSITIG